jgi:two-component system, cell cycle sensor histidine kinase PleC
MGSRTVSQVPFLMPGLPLPEETAQAAVRPLAFGPDEAGCRQIVEGAKQAILVRDGERLLYANPAYARLLGFETVEALTQAGKSFNDCLHPDERRRSLAAPAGRTANPARREFRLLRRDGSVIWVECHLSRIVWEGIAATLASMTDITGRKRAEEALQRSQKLFATIFQSSPDVLSLSTLEEGRLVQVNETFLEFCRLERSRVIGRSAEQLGLWKDPVIRRRLVRILERRGTVRNLEFAIDREGDLRHLSFSAEVIELDGQKLLLMAGRDITERRRQEEEVLRSKEAAELANRSKSDFLANMSHELRTPLSAIMGFSEMMRDQMLGPIGTPKYVEYAEDIHRSSEHLKQIINDVLDLSKIEAGRMELRETAVSLPALIADCVRLVRGRAATARVRLRVENRDTSSELRGDQRLLKQILLNLLSNAVTFTPQSGTVTVGARPGEAGGVELFVTDTGVGMSASEIEVALTRYGRVDGMLAQQHQGTGLGLPLARSLAELHGGRLAIRSERGKGTTVTVSLPADRVLGIRTGAGDMPPDALSAVIKNRRSRG